MSGTTETTVLGQAIELLDGLLMDSRMCGCSQSTGRWAADPIADSPRGDFTLHEDGCDMGYKATLPGFNAGEARYIAAMDPPVGDAILSLLIAVEERAAGRPADDVAAAVEELARRIARVAA